MRSSVGRLGDGRIRTLRAAALICGAAALVMSALFLGPASGASDENTEAPLNEAELERAELLFRHYCMDCHGPRVTGDDHDFTLRCPHVHGTDVEDYREVVLEGDGDMPQFFIRPESNGHLDITWEDFILLTLHEATFPENEEEEETEFPEDEEEEDADSDDSDD